MGSEFVEGNSRKSLETLEKVALDDEAIKNLLSLGFFLGTGRWGLNVIPDRGFEGADVQGRTLGAAGNESNGAESHDGSPPEATGACPHVQRMCSACAAYMSAHDPAQIDSKRHLVHLDKTEWRTGTVGSPFSWSPAGQPGPKKTR